MAHGKLAAGTDTRFRRATHVGRDFGNGQVRRWRGAFDRLDTPERMVPGSCQNIGVARPAEEPGAAVGCCIRIWRVSRMYSSGGRPSVGCNATMQIVKQMLANYRLQIRPHFARNMYGVAPPRPLTTQIAETVPLVPRSSHDRRNRPCRPRPGDSGCVSAGPPARGARTRFRPARLPTTGVPPASRYA